MSRQRSYPLCVWSIVSIMAVFFFAVDSMTDRNSLQRSAYFQAFEGNSRVMVTFKYFKLLFVGVE